MMNQSISSASSSNGGGSDPAKVSQLFEKIERSNNIEIEERSLKNLNQKLQLKLVDGAYLALHNSSQVPALLGWLSKRVNGDCTQAGFLNCIQIFRQISLKHEGKVLLRSIGCLEYLNELTRQVNDPQLLNELQETLKNLVQDGDGSSSEQQSNHRIEQPRNIASKHLNIMNIPEREELEDLGASVIKSVHNPFSTTTFNKKEFQMSTITQTSIPIKSEHNYMETMHKQQQLKEVCEMPYIMLCDEDEKLLFDLSVQLKFGDFKNILSATQKLIHLSFYDFPIEVFLQRTDIFRALLDLLEGSSTTSPSGNNIYTNLAQPALMTFVQRLKSMYQFTCNNVNKVSHIERSSDNIPQEPYIMHTYPCNHNGKWLQLEEETRDTNKYGTYHPKQSNMTAATLQNSLSCKAALTIILTKTIYLLKDTEKIGLYVQLFLETLDALLHIYRVEENKEFTEIIHLCLFAFDSVFDFYKDAVFEEVLIQPVLSLSVRFVSLLNSIEATESNGILKYQQPFTECLFLNSQNLQRTLRRSLFKNIYQSHDNFGRQQNDQNAIQILKFFERLEGELPTINTLQKNVTQSFSRAQDAYEKFKIVQSYKLNAEGLIQNEESSIIFIESLTQYYQSLDLLEVLLNCLQLRLDFPFEHLIIDTIMFGILSSDSSLDPKMEQLERVFCAFLQFPVQEIRERIIRKIYSKLRLQCALSVNKKTISNITLLGKFLYRKNILNQLINGMLINQEVSGEETRLQMNLGTLIIKILIIAYNEGGQIASKSNLNSHFLTFHSMMRSFPETIGLIDLIEENAATKSLRFHRILRDLFNQDPVKREFATSVLKNNLSKDSQDSQSKDLIADTFDLKRPFEQAAHELESINSNYDSSTVDIINIQSILMSTGSDFMIKKSCLEQLTHIIFDVSSKRGKQLFKSQNSAGSKDLFGFLVNEIITTFNTCQGYLRNQVSFLEIAQQSYINECFKFIFYSAIMYSEEQEIKGFFGKIRQLYLPKEKQDTDLQSYEHFLNSCLFFSGSIGVRANALRAIFVSVFHPVMLNTKIQKQQLANGSLKKSLKVHIAEFLCNAFVIIVPSFSQPLKQPMRNDLILGDEQIMYLNQRICEQENKSADSIALTDITQQFISKSQDKNENFNNLMRYLENLQNHILSLQSARDELMNSELLNSMVELLKILPTRDFEFSFLADFFMIISQILSSHKRFKEVSNLQIFINRLSDALKYHLLPFLIESGIQSFSDQDAETAQFTPRLYFIQRFLELINNLMQADLYIQQHFRLSSGIQDRILSNSSFIEYLTDLYALFKGNQMENRRKILVFMSLLISSFDTRHLKFERIAELLMSSIATHKMTLLFQSHSIVMMGIRTLMTLHQRRQIVMPKNLSLDESQMSVNLNAASIQYMQKFQSFGWILRFLENRDTRLRVLAWDLITELFDYEFLKANPSIIQTALNNYLKHQELFSVKISVLKFLIKASDCLIQNCDVFSDFDHSETDSRYLGSITEHMSVKLLLQMVSKQGLISHMHAILSQKDAPLLFITLSVKFLYKLVQMDHKRALPVLTQLDYWTFLVDLLRPDALKEIENHENRLILKVMKQQVLRIDDPCTNKDMIMLVLNSIIEFIFEGFKRDAQLANMLVKTTKLMDSIFSTLKSVIDSFNEDTLKLQNKNLLVIYFDKIVKLLHLALMHPRDFTVEVIQTFLYQEKRLHTHLPPCEQQSQRNWIYITEMFRIINLMSATCSYMYGQIEVKLALSRFISEFLIRVVGEDNHLDEMVNGFDGNRYFDENEVFSKDELRTYGSLILVEMGMVFKGLYLDKDQKMAQYGRGADLQDDQENQKIDITICLSILLAKCKSAKTIALEQNLAKKILEICQENVSALHLADIQKLTSKTSTLQAQKSTLGKSVLANNSSLVQSVFESQIKRQYKYAQYNDVDLCERETIRMLQILRHLFYQSGELLIPHLYSQKNNQSTISINQSKKPKKQETLGEKLINLWAQIFEELGNNDRYNDIIHETLRGAITFSAQNMKFKNIFAASSIPSASVKRNSLLKICIDKLLNENLQGNSQRMKFLFILLRSLSQSSEIAKELMKYKTIEDLLSKILPMCKNEKDIRMMRNYLTYFSSFIAGYSSTEEGQKVLLKLKELYEFTLFLLDTVTLQPQSQTAEARCLVNMVVYNLMFLRNTAFNRSNKLHFLSNPQFLPCLLAFLSAQQMQQARVKAYAAACLWVTLFNHQGVKAVLNRPEIISEMQLLRQEYQRQSDIENYHYYVDNSGLPERQQYNTNYVIPNKQTIEVEDQYNSKKMNQFTHSALNGILSLLSQ